MIEYSECGDGMIVTDREKIIQLRAAAINFVRLADDLLGQEQTIPKRNEAKLKRRASRRSRNDALLNVG